MPCYCWYDPPEEDKKRIKELCQEIVAIVKKLDRDGDPMGCQIRDVKNFIDHLYHPNLCKEKPNG